MVSIEDLYFLFCFQKRRQKILPLLIMPTLYFALILTFADKKYYPYTEMSADYPAFEAVYHGGLFSTRPML